MAEYSNPYGVTTALRNAKTKIDPQLITDFQTLGLGWVRLQVLWNSVELTKGVYDPGALAVIDDAVYRCNQAGLHVQFPFLQTPPSWHQVSVNCCPPGSNPWYMIDPVAAGQYADFLSNRYNGITKIPGYGPIFIDSFETGNENWDIHYCEGSPLTVAGQTCRTANWYIPALKECAPVIRKNSPNSYVGFASLWWEFTPHHTSFMQDIYAAGVKNLFDYVNMHFYSCPVDPYNDTNSQRLSLGGQINEVYNVMAANGDGKKNIWLTEWGASTDCISDAARVTYYNHLLDICRTNGHVGVVDFYTANYVDPAINAAVQKFSLTHFTAPHYTQTFFGLQTYIKDNPPSSWSSGGGCIQPLCSGGQTFSINPTSMSFAATVGAGNPPTQSMTLKNNEAVGGTWSAALSGGSWLSLSATSGSLAAGASVQDTLSVSIAGLSAGTYTETATITFVPSKGSSTVIACTVTLVLSAAGGSASFTLLPSSLSFSAIAGAGNPASQSVVLTNTGSVNGTWSLSLSGGSWVGADQTSGNLNAGSPVTVTISATTGTLSAGTYNATITAVFSPTGQSQQTQTCQATFTVTGTPSDVGLDWVAYFYPTDPNGTGTYWTEATGTAPLTPRVFTLNVNNGPGSSVDSHFTASINSAHTNGQRCIGYVNTSNNNVLVPIATVKANIDTWYKFYPAIDGIMLDTALATSGNLTYYTNLYTYIKGKGGQGFVSINPATVPPEAYLSTPACDSVTVYEGEYAGFQSFTGPAWMLNYPASSFKIDVGTVPDLASIQKTVNRAATYGIGGFYISSDPSQQAYSKMPSQGFFNNVVATVAAYGRGTVYYANPGDDLTAKTNALKPGDVLSLNDGVYPNMNWSVQGIAGTSTRHITIMATNDGKAIIDGGTATGHTFFMNNCSYIDVLGLVFRNAKQSLCYIWKTADHITVRRCTAHDAGNGNQQGFTINEGASFILVEDCAAWGRNRYDFIAYRSHDIIFRRCYSYAPYATGFSPAPRSGFGVYGSANVTLENCIGTHDLPDPSSAVDYYSVIWETTDGPTISNTTYSGCVFWGNWDGVYLDQAVNGNPTTFTNCVFLTNKQQGPNSSSKDHGDGVLWGTSQTGSVTACSFINNERGFNQFAGFTTITNSVFLNNSSKALVTGSGTSEDHNDFFGNAGGDGKGAHDTTFDPGYNTATYGNGGYLFIPAGSPVKGAGSGGADMGANILFQTVNGTLTTNQLWPWPMESRVMSELGVSPTYAANGGLFTTLGSLYGSGGGGGGGGGGGASGCPGGTPPPTNYVPKYPLPGQTFDLGVSNFIFGTNMSQDFATNTVRNTPAIQSQIASGGFTIMRCAIPNGSSNAFIDQTASASSACGTQMLVILDHADLAWNKSLVSYLANRCNLYEFSNEPDINGITWQQYLTAWNTQIPALRSINPQAGFLGPALGVFANVNSYLVPWLRGCVTSGVLPDGISYHVYPCTDPSCDQTCCTPKSGNFQNDAATLRTAIQGVTSAKMAICLTEWNIDASNPPKAYSYADPFNTTWTKAAMDSMVAGNLDVACQWDAAGNAGGGHDDLISTVSPYPAQVQYAPMVSEINKYLGTGGAVTHFLYVITAGNVYKYDMDNGFALVKTVAASQLGTGVRGSAADAASNSLYVAYGGDGGSNGTGGLLRYDLTTDAVTYHKDYSHGIDQLAITQDGATIYMPAGEAGSDHHWYTVTASTGVESGSTTIASGPHNTLVSLDNTNVYFGPRFDNNLYVYSNPGLALVKKIGPTKGDGIRPFTVNKAQTWVAMTLTGYMGFQVGSVSTGKILYTVPITGFKCDSSNNCSSWTTPCHGISMSPNEKEIYLLDAPNNYVHVYDVSNTPASAPTQVANIALTGTFNSNEGDGCPYDCFKYGWLTHSYDGRYVFVGDMGDVIDTNTRKVAYTLGHLKNARHGFLEVDFQNGAAVQTTTHFGLGRGPNFVGNAAATSPMQSPDVLSTTAAATVPHICVVPLENHGYDSATGAKYVIGNSNFPNINGYNKKYGSATKFYAVHHHSLGNYLAFGGGISHDGDSSVNDDSYDPSKKAFTEKTLVDSMASASPAIGWKHYAENLPSTGYLGGDSGGYIQHHNPWVYYASVRNSSSQTKNIVNYSNLASDLNAGTAPPFMFVQPTNSHNAHSGTDSACDNWVKSFVDMMQASTWYAQGGVIVLWWDESNAGDTSGIGTDTGGGHVACTVISAANSGLVHSSDINHYGLLRAIEEAYGLTLLGGSSNTSNGDLSPLMKGGTSSSTTISTSATSLAFSAIAGGANPPNQTLTVTNNNAAQSASYTAASDKSWLSVSPTSDSIPASGSITSTVSIALGSLAVGTYTGTVTYTGPSNSVAVTVTLTVTAAGNALSVNPTSLQFSAVVGGSDPPTQTVSLANSANSSASYTASTNQSWLTVSPTSGTVPASGSINSTVGILLGSLAVGTYTGIVTYVGPNNSVTVTVTLTVTTSGGTSTISISPSTLLFSATVGDTPPTAQVAVLTNNSTTTAQSYTTALSQTWLGVSPTTGSIPAGSNANSSISVTPGALGAGTYTGTVTYTGPNNTVTVTVTLRITSVTITPLTAYLTATATQTLPSANTLYTASGAQSGTFASVLLGKALGYGEIYSQGNTGAWAASGSIPSPSDHGWLWDVSALEGNDLGVGDYSFTVALNTGGVGAVAITADIHGRVYKRSSAGFYTAIADASLLSQTIPTAETSYTLSVSVGTTTSFIAGDKLYFDIILHVLTNTGPTTETIMLSALSVETVALTGFSCAQVSTPGYVSTPGGTIGGCGVECTPLSVYGDTVHSSLVTGDQLSTALGGTPTTISNLVGNGTGFDEVDSQGDAGSWAGLGAIGDPTGRGWLLDSPILEGTVIETGPWQATITLALG